MFPTGTLSYPHCRKLLFFLAAPRTPSSIFCRVWRGWLGFLCSLVDFCVLLNLDTTGQVVYISLHGNFVVFFVKAGLQSLAWKYDQGHIFALLKDIRYHLHYLLFSEKETMSIVLGFRRLERNSLTQALGQ